MYQASSATMQLFSTSNFRFLGHCLRRPQGVLISKYALTHSKPRPGECKGLFHEYSSKLINPEKSPPFLMKYEHWRRIVKPGSAWRLTAGTVGTPQERLSRAEREREIVLRSKLHCISMRATVIAVSAPHLEAAHSQVCVIFQSGSETKVRQKILKISLIKPLVVNTPCWCFITFFKDARVGWVKDWKYQVSLKSEIN